MTYQMIPIEFEDYDDYPEDDELDEFEQAISECYYSPMVGFCLIAGTEYCDWDCLFSADDFEEETSC